MLKIWVIFEAMMVRASGRAPTTPCYNFRCSNKPNKSLVFCGSRFVFDASPWVGFVVYLGQMLEVKVSVDLGGTDIGMSEQFLHATKVVA